MSIKSIANLPMNQLETRNAPDKNQKMPQNIPETVDLNNLIKKSSILKGYNTHVTKATGH